MYTYLRDLFEFLWAVINSWAGYSTGGVALHYLACGRYSAAFSTHGGLGLLLRSFSCF